MRVSVVVRTKDEAPRLRLTLTSLIHQTVAPELIVVNDGSSDETTAVIAQARQAMEVKTVTHAAPKGRSAAANAGAERASGDILLFLDGDTLAGPDLVERHSAFHRDGCFLIGRGETYHLRCTRLFRDPESGLPWPEAVSRVARLPEEERMGLRITREQVARDFPAVAARAQPAIYPGAAPRRLYECEMDALRNWPDSPVLWAAACGCNLSVPRRPFLDTGGFDPAMDNNEHRELALRLCSRGGRMAAVEGARSFHMTHRTGWRDPLVERHWERVFQERHRIPEIKLLTVFWASLSQDRRVPPEARILSLPQLERAARSEGFARYDAAWEALGGTGMRDESVTAPRT